MNNNNQTALAITRTFATVSLPAYNRCANPNRLF